MARSKKSLLQSIQTFKELIDEHRAKIAHALETNTDLETIPHWQREIANFERQIEKLLKKL